MRVKHRSRAKPRSDKKYFTNTAKKVDFKNHMSPMRGGIRL